MNEKNDESINDDLSLLKVEIKQIIERKPPNERILSYKLEEVNKDE